MFEPNALRGALYTDIPLAPYTTWRVGGPAQRMFIPADLADLQQFLAMNPKDEPLLWLGLGSNVLIRDNGVRGSVILTKKNLTRIQALDQQTWRVEAGASCAKFARESVRAGCSGAEFLAGIPGTLGGALRMNAGAFGGEIWEWVLEVETLTRQGQLQQRQSLLAQRKQTQPIGTFNCGSVFQNPTAQEHQEDPQRRYAGRMIEQLGLKGCTIGDACVAEKHANFILNRGHATAADLEALIHLVQTKVYQHYGIRLRTEVKIYGE